MIKKVIDVAVEDPIAGNEMQGIIITAGVILIIVAIIVIYRMNNKK